jgi:MFS family permease
MTLMIFPTAYLVELWPYAERSRGIAWFQFFGKGAGFFATYVNPIGLSAIAWKWLLVYVCWLAFELVFVYFLFPETYNRTLEELAFRKRFTILPLLFYANQSNLVFEGKEKSERAVIAVEKGMLEDSQVEHAEMNIITDGRQDVKSVI